MKLFIKVLALSLFVLVAQSCKNESQSELTNVPKTVGGAKLTLDKETHDYGVMNKGANGDCVFKVTNTGDQPLIISDCKGSCGCTVPKWSKDPIAPGASSEIQVTYDTKRVGIINKSVTIVSNSKDEETKVIRISGEVKDPEAPAEAPGTAANSPTSH